MESEIKHLYDVGGKVNISARKKTSVFSDRSNRGKQMLWRGLADFLRGKDFTYWV